jgi:hypothetical protein
MPNSATLLSALVILAAGATQAQTLTQIWTEVGENGAVLARVVVNTRNDCPSITLDGKPSPMKVRLPIPQGLKPVCELRIPPTTHTASLPVQGRTLALPPADPSHVVVIGDTGCRIKGTAVQDCNDPAKWPFRKVAVAAAESKPDLVIHVGDYLYREQACPPDQQARCGGTPVGDTWEAWDADFFAPAAQLLAAAPWAFSRGNHESCERSWRGWFYYLDPRPFKGSCQAFSAPYVVRLGKFELAMLDSASVTEKSATKNLDPKAIARYSAELKSLRVEHAWIAFHHPVWGLRPPAADAPAGSPPVVSETDLTAAWEKSPPKGIDMILSGHIHLFEFLTFDQGRPPQLVAGDGGTEMAMAIPPKIAGLKLRGATLLSGQDAHEFGYTVLTKSGNTWNLALTNTSGKQLQSAALPNH